MALVYPNKDALLPTGFRQREKNSAYFAPVWRGKATRLLLKAFIFPFRAVLYINYLPYIGFPSKRDRAIAAPKVTSTLREEGELETALASAAAEGRTPKSKDAGLAVEEKAALDYVQVSAVGDVSESGKVVGGGFLPIKTFHTACG